jgi:hypothetical protein
MASSMLDVALLERALELLGETLDARALHFELVVIGGSALLLRGVTRRPTRDLDVMAIVDKGEYRPAEPMPAELQAAVVDVGVTLGIGTDWLNGKASGLLNFELPRGFKGRTEPRHYGALTIRIADRLDLIYQKLDATVSEGRLSRHFSDLQALRPTDDELLGAGRWLTSMVDVSPGFREEMIQALGALGVADAEQRL